MRAHLFSLPRALLLAAVLALAGGNALAMWAQLTEQQLFDASEVIVTGTLIGQSRVKTGATDMTLGVVRVEHAFKGGAGQIVLIALPGPEQPRSSSDIAYKVGQTGLWFLRLRSAEERGIYVADHPQRFVAREAAQPQIERLRKQLPAR